MTAAEHTNNESPRKGVAAIVFDLDGTLLNTLDDLADATNWALRTNALPQRSLDEVRQFVGNGVGLLIRRAVPEGTDEALYQQVFADFRRRYVAHCQDKTCLYPGIDNMLRQLRARGYRLAIVSNKLQDGVDELYQRYFKDTVEVAVGERPGIARKPAPDMVQLALQALDIPTTQAVYVGDSDVDLATAQASHLPCISVLWGFRDRPFLTAHGATTFAETPADILRIITT